jgi:hypothetical protein
MDDGWEMPLGWKELVEQIRKEVVMNKNGYVVMYRVPQYEPPSAEATVHIKEITPETKIADIISWQRAELEYVESIRKGEYLYPMTIQMMEK